MVEHYNSFTRRRVDLYNFGDIIAIGNGEIAIVQVTSRNNLSSRRQKILDNPHAHAWVMNGGTIYLYGYDQPKGKGTRYRLKEETVVP